MRQCEINNCGKATTMMAYRFKIQNGTLHNVWVCYECADKEGEL